MIDSSTVHPLRLADAGRAVYHVFVRDLELEALIGVHRHERKRRQPVRINIDLAVRENVGALQDRLSQVLDYEVLVDEIKSLVAAGHINLVETLAEQVAVKCLADDRVGSVRVRIEKLAVLPEAASAGVEIERRKARPDWLKG